MIKTNQNNFISSGLLTAQILLSVICMVQLFVIITYLFHGALSAYLFPASIVIAISLNFLFAGRLGISKKPLLIATVFSFFVLTASLFIAWLYFDLSWDGQWYHQAAIYHLAGNWNPIFKPLGIPDSNNSSSILHFPKSSWYFGAAVLRLFGTVEMGKAYNIILIFAAIGPVYALCRNFKIPTRRSAILTVLILLNPVVWSELTGYLNDGDIYLLFVIYLTSVISWIRYPKPIYILIGAMAAICLVNIKFTGLVFFLIASLFVFIYILIKERSRIRSFLLFHLIAGLLSVLVFGFNPYVTNMLTRGNPFYPLMGSKQFPSVFANGDDENEAYETPKNIVGKSLPVRLIYANFSLPGNAPYNGENNAQLTSPFAISLKSFHAYDYQETRVSGFGPYFGVLLVLMCIVLPILLIAVKGFRLSALMFLGLLCCCLSVSKYFWWPRLFPMLWLAPLFPLFLLWTDHAESFIRSKNNRWIRSIGIYGWLLAAMIGINGFIVAFIHMRWETVSSIKLRTQLEQIRNEGQPILVDYGWFELSMEEKLNNWDIKYTAAPLRSSDKGTETLTSVVAGYPNQVLYRLKSSKVTK